MDCVGACDKCPVPNDCMGVECVWGSVQGSHQSETSEALLSFCNR